MLTTKKGQARTALAPSFTYFADRSDDFQEIPNIPARYFAIFRVFRRQIRIIRSTLIDILFHDRIAVRRGLIGIGRVVVVLSGNAFSTPLKKEAVGPVPHVIRN